MVKTTVDYSTSDTKALQALCKERGVKAESQSRENLIRALLPSEGKDRLVVGISKSHTEGDGKKTKKVVVIDEQFEVKV